MCIRDSNKDELKSKLEKSSDELKNKLGRLEDSNTRLETQV